MELNLKNCSFLQIKGDPNVEASIEIAVSENDLGITLWNHLS